MIPIIDGHLDLAWNALAYGRDQTLPLAAIRRQEATCGLTDRETATVCLPQLRQAQVGIVVATLFTRAGPGRTIADCLQRVDSDFPARSIAHAAAQGQLAYYRLLERSGHLRIIIDRGDLLAFWRSREASASLNGPIGCIVLMECADAVTSPDEVTLWAQQGVRMIGLTHFGQGAQAMGNVRDGAVDTGLADEGRALLEAMEERGLALDVSHLSDRSLAQAMDRFGGRVCASHCNCRHLSPGDRQLSDSQIRALVERDGVIGVVVHNGMLSADWQEGVSHRGIVTIEKVGEHVDHICQLAGDAKHAAIGSDLDGGYGRESCPADLDSIEDLQKLGAALSDRGYGDDDIAAVFHGNWLRFWEEALPDGAA